MTRCLWLAALVCSVAAAKPPVVPGFERFHADGSARGGRLLATELGCVNCHAAADKSLLVKPAPVLTDVGGRAEVEAVLAELERDGRCSHPEQLVRKSDEPLAVDGAVEALVRRPVEHEEQLVDARTEDVDVR